VAGAAAAAVAAQEGDLLVAVRPGDTAESLRTIAAEVLKRRPAAVVVLAGGTGEDAGACFLVQAGPAGPADVAAIGGRVRDRLGAKGGGRGAIFQGKGGALVPAEELFRAARGTA
jgi:alanyl-tRNA synthetase